MQLASLECDHESSPFGAQNPSKTVIPGEIVASCWTLHEKMATATLTTSMKQAAKDLGFALMGVCPAATPTGLTQFRSWLERGFDGQMDYLRLREAAYEHPQHVLDGVRSIAMLAFPYHTAPPQAVPTGYGRVSRYAWSTCDYHDVLHDHLRKLAAHIRERSPEARVRGVVDTAPLLERDFAQRAGLGWIAKNTMLINRAAGSWFFLAALLTDLELDYGRTTRSRSLRIMHSLSGGLPNASISRTVRVGCSEMHQLPDH